jgi:hypothetical protein
MVVGLNIKLQTTYRFMGATSQVANCDHFVCETGKKVALVG